MKEIRTSFHQLPDGSILEMLWNPITQEASFVHQLPDGNKNIIPEYVSAHLTIEPLADSSLIEHKIILLPSAPMPYINQDDLLKKSTNLYTGMLNSTPSPSISVRLMSCLLGYMTNSVLYHIYGFLMLIKTRVKHEPCK